LQGNKKVVGLSSLTAKILCKKHNYDLSDVDAAGKEAFDTFREMRRLENVREKLGPRLRPVANYQVHGILLERWFLKTLINLSSSSEYSIGQPAMGAGIPFNELVEMAFGLKPFVPRSRLYFMLNAGQNIYSSDKIEFSPLYQ